MRTDEMLKVENLQAALERATRWQPIETAPKDQEILGWANAWHLIKWFEKWDYDRRFPEAATEGGWIIGGGHVVKPTHWMPLPEPPR